MELRDAVRRCRVEAHEAARRNRKRRCRIVQVGAALFFDHDGRPRVGLTWSGEDLMPHFETVRKPSLMEQAEDFVVVEVPDESEGA